MDKKKRIMFFLEDDSYYITLKLLLILNVFECSKKPFIDYRKLSILFELVKNEKIVEFISEQINNDFSDMDLIKNDKISDLVCNAKLNIPVIKRILFFLESKGFIHLVKNNKKNCIDVLLMKSTYIDKLFKDALFKNDIIIAEIIKKLVPNARWIKYTTLKKKLFGNNEVIKWDD